MSHRILWAAILSASVFTACQQDGSDYTIDRKTVDGLPTVTTTETSVATAKVDAIDYTNRSIALTGSDGKTQIFHITRAVRNFSQIKKGDTVKVEYYSRLKASLRKVNEAPETTVSDSVALATLGEKPGILCTRNAQIEANVESINYETRVLKLKTTTGNIMTITADKKLKDLNKVQAGDQVVFDYTEAVSINVD